MLNFTHHNTDFRLDTAWTFTTTGHGKGAGDGIGTFLKSTARRATLSKGVCLSSSKDFFDFLKKNQLETAAASSKASPTVSALFLEASDIEKVKNRFINPQIVKLRSAGKAV